MAKKTLQTMQAERDEAVAELKQVKQELANANTNVNALTAQIHQRAEEDLEDDSEEGSEDDSEKHQRAEIDFPEGWDKNLCKDSEDDSEDDSEAR